MKYEIVIYMVLDEESRKPSHTDDIQFVCVHVYVHFTQMCHKHEKKTKGVISD